MAKIVLPELGEGILEATVAEWKGKEGDAVLPDDDIVDVVTDKASFGVPAGKKGIIKKICVQAGEIVKVGQTLALIESSESADV